jgi:uncharacterized protein
MAEADPEYTVINESRHCTVASRVRLAATSATRRRGLLDISQLDENAGLWIVPSEAVHTFGMRIPIDVIFLDRKGQVRKIRSNLPPWRLAFDLRAHSVLELGANALGKSGTEVGDRLVFRRNGKGGDSGQ